MCFKRQTIKILQADLLQLALQRFAQAVNGSTGHGICAGGGVVQNRS